LVGSSHVAQRDLASQTPTPSVGRGCVWR
jgi:hypothetical protein